MGSRLFPLEGSSVRVKENYTLTSLIKSLISSFKIMDWSPLAIHHVWKKRVIIINYCCYYYDDNDYIIITLQVDAGAK